MAAERPDWAKPYKIIRTPEGKRIGLVGATAEFTPFYERLGWKVTAARDSILQAVEEVKGLERINYVRVRDIIGRNRLIIDQAATVLRPGDIPAAIIACAAASPCCAYCRRRWMLLT